jgi:hypothetical protein
MNYQLCKTITMTILTPGTTNQGLSWCITQKIHGHVFRFPLYTFSIYAAIRRNTNPAETRVTYRHR